MTDPTELTHEQLAELMVNAHDVRHKNFATYRALGLLKVFDSCPCCEPSTCLSDRGRELVDIAVRAVNAELRERGSRG